MIGEFQPKFDYLPKWKKDPTGAWVPDIDETTGRQNVDRVALPTYHQLFWPGDKTVSAISEQTWFTLSKGWPDSVNPVSGKYWFIGTNATGPRYIAGDTFHIAQDWEWSVPLPAGTKKVSIQLDPHDHAIGWTFEVKAQ